MVIRYISGLRLRLTPSGRQVLRWDLLRGATKGFISTDVIRVLALLVAHDVFQAGEYERACIAMAPCFGLLAAMAYERFSEYAFKTRNVQAAVPSVIFVAGAMLTALSKSSTGFVWGAVLMGFAESLRLSAMTAIWHNFYDEEIRGQVSSLSLWVTTVMAICASSLGGYLLDQEIYFYQPIFAALGVASLCCSWFTLRMPKVPIVRRREREGRGALAIVRGNSVIAEILLSYFLVGFGSHLLFAQKVEYLVDPREGFNMTNFEISFLSTAIPEIARLLSLPLFARLFDRINFTRYRMMVNAFLFVFAGMYFNSHILIVLFIGSLFHGLAESAGQPAWSLWVTKYTNRDESASVMSLHSFLTGIRGIAAPLMAYSMYMYFRINVVSWFAIFLYVCSTMVLIRVARREPTTVC